jgi:hypothetical protein
MPRLAPPHTVPEPLAIGDALRMSEGLARLGWLLKESTRRLNLITPALPGALKRFVSAGTLDEEGWTLLAANAAVGAKLRQLHPRLEQMLAEAGVQPSRVRIKVLSPRA